MAIFRKLIQPPIDERKWHDELFRLLEAAVREDADFLALYSINVTVCPRSKKVTFTQTCATQSEGDVVWIAPEYDSGLLMIVTGGSGLVFDCHQDHDDALVDIVQTVCRTFGLRTFPSNGEKDSATITEVIIE